MIDFNEAEFPGLEGIFRDVDNAIAAIIASDPAFRVKRAASRRGRLKQAPAMAVRAKRATKRQAA
jgi:hypothetical protein